MQYIIRHGSASAHFPPENAAPYEIKILCTLEHDRKPLESISMLLELYLIRFAIDNDFNYANNKWDGVLQIMGDIGSTANIEVPGINRRNYLFLLWEAVFSFSGFTFFSASSVIPVFIDAYTGNLELAGLVNTLRPLMSFLPLVFIGPFISSIKSYPAFIGKWMAVARPALLFMIPVLFSGFSNLFIVWIFILLITFFSLEEGLTMVPWLDLCADVAGSERMGKLFGYQQIIGGVVSFGSGFLIKYLLETTSIANNLRYSIIFGVGAIIMSGSVIMIIRVKVPRRQKPPDSPSFLEYMKILPSSLSKNRNMVSVCVINGVANFSGVIIPFVILFAKRTFLLDMGTVSTLVYIQIIGTTLGSFVWAKCSQRIGNKHVIIYSQVLIGIVYLASFASLLIQSPSALTPVLYFIAFTSGAYMSSWLGYSAYIAEVTEPKDRSMYYVIFYAICAPFTLIPYFAGLVADKMGFLPVLVTGGIASVLAVIMATRMKVPSAIHTEQTGPTVGG